ncbi:hypothetical protein O4220_02320 [Rhodococcus ruber]|uniref:Uncharacterized protein n=1 Tax=Rhodococcus ruber TaxID=1830 RepID=A0ABT4M8P9_9NOCA|nr:hypothetical protein [Rhodococcus ruber]MCZ4517332.1 hypothetical protein [Rhodococcus ruber]
MYRADTLKDKGGAEVSVSDAAQTVDFTAGVTTSIDARRTHERMVRRMTPSTANQGGRDALGTRWVGCDQLTAHVSVVQCCVPSSLCWRDRTRAE